MTIPYLKADKFFEYIKSFGVAHVSDDYSEEDVVVYGKDGNNIPIQIRQVYYCTQVAIICDGFGIPIPEEHKKVYDQIMKLKKDSKPKEK